MTKIDIFSGFLGAGKTTLIKKLINEAYAGEKLVLIENEFGEIGIDGGFLAEAGIKINELNSGCICCSLVGDFAEALKKVNAEYHPNRILIEPSGVGKLSDVLRAVKSAELPNSTVNTFSAVVDANKCKMYMKNFGEFFNDQIETANCIIFSHVDVTSPEKLAKAVELVREHNPKATIVTAPWDQLSGKKLLDAMEHADTLESELAHLMEEEEHEHHHDGECCCGHNHEHEHEHDHEHEHHHDGECCCGHNHEHEHEHDHEHGHHHHDGECCCGHDHEHEHDHDHDHDHGHHHHHGHHHADEVFKSWGVETSKSFSKEMLEAALNSLSDAVRFGMVLRAKGIVASEGGKWLHFDYVPGEVDIREGSAGYTGRLCVIGSKIDEEELSELFGV